MKNRQIAVIAVVLLSIIGLGAVAYLYSDSGAQAIGISGKISTWRILDDAVTGAKIADDAIGSEHYKDDLIDTTTLRGEDIGTILYVEADNATDIQVKIDALPSNGGMVYIPEGEYNIASELSITKDNVTLMGAGKSTVISRTGWNDIINVTSADHISIKDIAFSEGAFQINFHTVTYSEISNCVFTQYIQLDSSEYNIVTNNKLNGIYIISSSDHNKVIDNSIGVFGGCLKIDHSERNIVEGNYMSGSAESFRMILIDDSSYNKILANTVVVTSGNYHIIYLDDSCHYNQIQNNFIDATSASSEIFAIYTDGSIDQKYNQIHRNIILNASINILDRENVQAGCKHTIITDNVIDGWNKVQYGICIDEVAAVSGFDDQAYNLISGNKIYNCTMRAIRISHSCHNTITDNECFDNTEDGIILDSGANYNIVSGNDCHNNSVCGIMVEYYASTANLYNLITNNYCHDNDKDGIMIYKSDANIVSDNFLYNNGYSGIILLDTADNNVVTGNLAINNGWDAAAPYGRDGITVHTNSDNNLINDNKCYDDQSTKTQQYGVNIVSSTCDNNIIRNNDLRGNDQSGAYDVGTGTDMYERYTDLFMDVLALSTTHVHAAIAGPPAITNGNMEAVNSWTDRGTPSTNARSNEQAHAGTYSRKIVTDAISEGAYQDITTVIGYKYTLTGWLYVTTGDAELGKEDTDGSDQVFSSQATEASWTEFSITFTATATTSRIFFQSDATAVSTFYADDFSIDKVEIETAITNPDVPRTVSITTTNNAAPTGDVTITGVDGTGVSVTDDITVSAGATAYSNKAFATVSKITIPKTVTSADNVSVGIYDKLGLSNKIYATGDVYKCKRSNADYTVPTVSVAYGTVDFSGDPLGAGNDITLYYRSNLNVVS